MITKPSRKAIREKRHYRLRKNINGTAQKPRLCVFRSNAHIYAQIIDDATGTTLVSASTNDKDLRDKISNKANKEAAKEIGTIIGKKAVDKGITTVIFDRGGYVYHGKIQVLADAAREAGLQF